MEEEGAQFLPGLVKVMEARLGPLGRPLSTTLILLIVLAVIFFCGRFLYTDAVVPALSFLLGADQTLLLGYASLFGVGALIAGLLSLYHACLLRRMRRSAKATDERIKRLETLYGVKPLPSPPEQAED